MTTLTDSLTACEALNRFYDKHKLGEEGGLNKSWAWLKVGRFYVPFPNTESRKRALVFHDIHHLVTGYPSTWKGEAEISAWEISSGCGNYSAAWMLDIWGFFVGLILFPKATFNAFIRGRHSLSLYKYPVAKEELMMMPLVQIKTKLNLDKPQTLPGTTTEILSFTGWAVVSVFAFCVPFIMPYVALLWWLLH